MQSAKRPFDRGWNCHGEPDEITCGQDTSPSAHPLARTPVRQDKSPSAHPLPRTAASFTA